MERIPCEDGQYPGKVEGGSQVRRPQRKPRPGPEVHETPGRLIPKKHSKGSRNDGVLVFAKRHHAWIVSRSFQVPPHLFGTPIYTRLIFSTMGTDEGLSSVEQDPFRYV